MAAYRLQCNENWHHQHASKHSKIFDIRKLDILEILSDRMSNVKDWENHFSSTLLKERNGPTMPRHRESQVVKGQTVDPTVLLLVLNQRVVSYNLARTSVAKWVFNKRITEKQKGTYKQSGYSMDHQGTLQHISLEKV
ncbi:hypothetical protein J6590_064752 [Homalodisca vitripennis]|nr:hypothetical protein J6590_064752 [Homalodisca vitripennis]